MGMKLGPYLKGMLSQQGVRQKEVAAELGVHESRVSNWLSGQPIPPEHLGRIAELAGVSLQELAQHMDDEQLVRYASQLLTTDRLVGLVRALAVLPASRRNEIIESACAEASEAE